MLCITCLYVTMIWKYNMYWQNISQKTTICLHNIRGIWSPWQKCFLILSRLLVCCSVYHFSSSNYGRSYYLDENISASTKNQTYTGKWVTPVITICPDPAVMEEDLSTEDIKCFSSILLVGCQFTSCKFFLILHSHISVTKSTYLFF